MRNNQQKTNSEQFNHDKNSGRLKFRKWAYNISVFSLVVLLLISVYKIGEYSVKGATNKQMYEDIQENFYTEPFVAIEESLEVSEAEVDHNEETPEVMKEFQSLLEVNPETVGWLKINNTIIDYPVVQARDNEYYLHRSFDLKEYVGGAIFMDFRNDFSQLDQNTIIYGHQMKNGTMFQDLNKFKDRDFFLQNRTVSFDTIYEKMEWEVFSVFVTDTAFYYINPQFNSEKEFQDYLTTIKEKSLYPIDMEITSNDKILTLSTCSYDFYGARLVVLAKLITN